MQDLCPSASAAAPSEPILLKLSVCKIVQDLILSASAAAYSEPILLKLSVCKLVQCLSQSVVAPSEPILLKLIFNAISLNFQCLQVSARLESISQCYCTL